VIVLLLAFGCGGETGVDSDNPAADSGDPGALDGSTTSDAAGGAGTFDGSSAGAAGTLLVEEPNICQPGLYYFCVDVEGCYGQKGCLASGDAYGDCRCLPEDLVTAAEDPASLPPPPYDADPSVPLINPAASGAEFPGEGCPTRPELAHRTPCSDENECSYGYSCWWEAYCAPAGEWWALIPFC
jgi:hypothetical protein